MLNQYLIATYMFICYIGIDSNFIFSLVTYRLVHQLEVCSILYKNIRLIHFIFGTVRKYTNFNSSSSKNTNIQTIQVTENI